jgi:hypothetical protein
MTRFVLPVATVKVLLLTAVVLYGSGWLTPRSHSKETTREQRTREALLRYRQGGTDHWHCCLVQH